MSVETKSVDIRHADVTRLEEVLDRDAVGDVCRSFHDLFGLSVRVFSQDGTLVADVHEERAICRYVNDLSGGRMACRSTVGAVKSIDPADGTVLHPCFTGAVYRVTPIAYQGRRIGRVVIGPYLPAETTEVPKSLLVIDDRIDKHAAREHLTEMPRVRTETAERISAHLSRVIDLLLFAGHRAHLTSEMHIASVRESFRELAEKTEKLQAAYDRLKELDRLKSNFLATVSHELRTPLTSIIGYSEMLHAGMAGELNEEQRDFVHTIHSKGEHLLALITSLLDLSKLEQGAVHVDARAVDAKALVDEIAKTVLPTASKKGITVHAEAAPGTPAIAGDATRLRQILLNLTDNALKFTPKNGHVYLSAKQDFLDPGGDGLGAVLMSTPRPAVRIEVRDTGIGMPSKELPKIFDAFYQIDGSSTREHGGAGLGLSIVKRLVDAHGGTVRVESVIGQGTTFIVTLPAVDDGF